MNTILLVLALLSVGVITTATYVFMVAARNYVSESSSGRRVTDVFPVEESDNPDYIVRSTQDRRQINNVIDFPITLSNGQVISHDRRLSERRSAG